MKNKTISGNNKRDKKGAPILFTAPARDMTNEVPFTPIVRAILFAKRCDERGILKTNMDPDEFTDTWPGAEGLPSFDEIMKNDRTDKSEDMRQGTE